MYFQKNNKQYVVETQQFPGLWRSQAGVYYEPIENKPHMIQVTKFDGSPAGYKVFARQVHSNRSSWINVNESTGDRLSGKHSLFPVLPKKSKNITSLRQLSHSQLTTNQIKKLRNTFAPGFGVEKKKKTR